MCQAVTDTRQVGAVEHILLVEDDNLIAGAFKAKVEVFFPGRLTVHVATTLKEATEVYEQLKIDGLLPKTAGFYDGHLRSVEFGEEVTRSWVKDVISEGLVPYHTAFTADRQLSYDMRRNVGCEFILTKPFADDDLVALLGEMVQIF